MRMPVRQTKRARILSWSLDDMVHVWNATTGEEMLTLKHEDNVQGAVWNSDESQIFSWSDDGTVRVWNATTGEEMLTLKHESNVRGAMWNSDESQIFSWSLDGTVHVWNAVTGEQQFTPVPTPSADTMGVGATWNTDERQILSWVWWWRSGGSPSGTIHVWDVGMGEEVLTLPPKRMFGASWNRDGSLILLLDLPRVLDAVTGEAKFPGTRQRGWTVGAKWNANENQLFPGPMTAQCISGMPIRAKKNLFCGIVTVKMWPSAQRGIGTRARFSPGPMTVL